MKQPVPVKKLDEAGFDHMVAVVTIVGIGIILGAFVYISSHANTTANGGNGNVATNSAASGTSSTGTAGSQTAGSSTDGSSSAASGTGASGSAKSSESSKSSGGGGNSSAGSSPASGSSSQSTTEYYASQSAALASMFTVLKQRDPSYNCSTLTSNAEVSQCDSVFNE